MFFRNLFNALRVKELNYFCINYGDQKVFSIENHHKYLSPFSLHLNTCDCKGDVGEHLNEIYLGVK